KAVGALRSAGERDVAVGLTYVAVTLPAADGHDLPPFAVGDLELLDESGREQVLHEHLALLPDGWQRVRFPPHDEVGAADVRQSRLRALQLRERAIQRVFGHGHDRSAQRRTRTTGERAALEDAWPLDAERRDAVAEPDLTEAPYPEIARQLFRRPRGDP